MRVNTLSWMVKGSAGAGLVAIAALFASCSDGSDSNVAGGVTDIGNSIASGIVVDVAGAPVQSARVVAYYDSWNQSSIKDSVETVTDGNGLYELKVDSAASYVLYASDEASGNAGFAETDSSKQIVIGERRAYSGHIAGRNTGSVRIVGSLSTVELDADGYFIFNDMPRGNVVIAYTESSKGEQARIQFTTDGEKAIYVLPEMDFVALDSSWLAVDKADYYSADGYDGIHIDAPMVNGWVRPVSSSSEDVISSSSIESDSSSSSSSEESSSSADTVAVDENLIASLAMDGSEIVYDDDSTQATADEVEYVDGVNGKAIVLKPGQFISLDSLDICAGDFTISLWTKWNGPNDRHQILVSERAYWSDSTSRFQWHFEGNVGWFTVMKSIPGASSAVYFADSSALPVGEWAHVALVSKNHQVSMYVNGKVLSTQAEDGSIISSYEFIPNDLDRAVPLRIGGNEIDAETWNGALADIRIENIARGEAWIKEQYELYK